MKKYEVYYNQYDDIDPNIYGRNKLRIFASSEENAEVFAKSWLSKMYGEHWEVTEVISVEKFTERAWGTARIHRAE